MGPYREGEEPKPIMHGREKSDSVIVAGKSPNKAGRPATEATERRTEAKENASQQRTRRAQNRESVSQALERVRQAARQRKKERFTALFHHITVDLLRLSFFALKRDAAPGVDGVTWQDYEADLERKLEDLHARVRRASAGELRSCAPRWRVDTATAAPPLRCRDKAHKRRAWPTGPVSGR
jgi:RNA-directed DNA polymerase